MAHRQRKGRSAGESRRRFLFRMGAGAAALGGFAAAAQGTEAFTGVTGSRGSAVDLAADDQALVGIVGRGPVQKNSQEPMVDLTNNWAATATFTVSLSTCSDGTLYDYQGDSGCSVTFPVDSGSTATVDISASVTGTITYSVSASGTDFSFSTTGSVNAEAGNVASAVDVKQPDADGDFTAALPQGQDTDGQFEVKAVDVRDGDGDNDLVEVKYEVFEGTVNDTMVAEKIVSFAATDKYAPKGNPSEVIEPDGGYVISTGNTYTLKVTGTDADGNFSSVTVQDTT